MSRTPRAALVASALLAAVLSSGHWESRESRAAEPLDLTCSAQAPTVPLGGAVTVKAWARSPAGRALRYTWTATAGRIEGKGAEARWSLAELRPGTFAASVTAADGVSVSAECLVRVTVRRDAQPRGM